MKKVKSMTKTAKRKMSIPEMATNSGVNMGYFGFDPLNQTLTWHNAPGVENSDITELGDIVYFMFVNGVLQKIGAAGATGGWLRRVKEYCRQNSKCRTTQKIIRCMGELGATRIDVWGLQSPRITKRSLCHASEKYILLTLATHRENEKRYTTMHLSEDPNNSLFFCTCTKGGV